MACPSGCINGGGQLKSDTPVPAAEWVAVAQRAYRDSSTVVTLPENNVEVQRVYSEWLKDDASRRTALHTAYRAVENTSQNGLAVKW
jgi:iron only hydrogenase large subunit-like protein